MERTGSMCVLRAVNAPTLVNHCEAGFLDCIAPHGKQALAGTPQKLSTLDLKKSSSRPRPESMPLAQQRHPRLGRLRWLRPLVWGRG